VDDVLASIHASPDGGNVQWRRRRGVSQNACDAGSTTGESMRGAKMRSAIQPDAPTSSCPWHGGGRPAPAAGQDHHERLQLIRFSSQGIDRFSGNYRYVALVFHNPMMTRWRVAARG
jgi:hypothetical protein